MRVAFALAVCMAAFTLTGCFEGPKGDKGDKGDTGRPDLLGLLDLLAPPELRERTFRFISIQRMAPARMLMRLL
jgi:hypothetical protein